MLVRMWSKGNSPPVLVGVQPCTATMDIVWQFLRKKEINLPQDTAIPLLGICPKDSPSYHKDTCSTMFIGVLFIKARNLKQSRCLSIEEWIKKCSTFTQWSITPWFKKKMAS